MKSNVQKKDGVFENLEDKLKHHFLKDYYYQNEINDENDNPPIGIILCTDKENVNLEYALGGLNNNIFASKYVLYMPNKDELIAKVEEIVNNNKH